MKKIIDVSEWQDRLSNSTWDEIKKNCDGVIMRFGYRGYGTGALRLDAQVLNNLNNCKLREIPYGFYFFTQAMNASEAIEEVELICKNIDITQAELGIWCDSEMSNNGSGRGDTLTREQRTIANAAFIKEVNELFKTDIKVDYSKAWEHLKNDIVLNNEEVASNDTSEDVETASDSEQDIDPGNED